MTWETVCGGWEIQGVPSCALGTSVSPASRGFPSAVCLLNDLITSSVTRPLATPTASSPPALQSVPSAFLPSSAPKPPLNSASPQYLRTGAAQEESFGVGCLSAGKVNRRCKWFTQ